MVVRPNTSPGASGDQFVFIRPSDRSTRGRGGDPAIASRVERLPSSSSRGASTQRFLPESRDRFVSRGPSLGSSTRVIPRSDRGAGGRNGEVLRPNPGEFVPRDGRGGRGGHDRDGRGGHGRDGFRHGFHDGDHGRFLGVHGHFRRLCPHGFFVGHGHGCHGHATHFGLSFGFYHSSCDYWDVPVLYYPTYPVYYDPYPLYPAYPVYSETTIVNQAPPVIYPPEGVEGVNADVLPQEGAAAPQTAPATQETTEQIPGEVERAQKLMLEGLEAFTAGEYDKAARSFLQVGLDDPDNVDALLAYAVARFATGDYSVAAIALRRGVSKYPEVVNSAFDIRDRYGEVDDFVKHVEALEDYVRQNPDDADGWLMLGFVRHFTGERAQAQTTFEILQRRSVRDTELADLFINAKAPAESGPEGSTTEPSDVTPPASGPMGAAGERELLQANDETISREPAYTIPSP